MGRNIEDYLPPVKEDGLLTRKPLKAGDIEVDRANIKGIYLSAVVAVAVPSITDPDIAKVDVDISAALTAVSAVGDVVLALPQEALPTNARQQGSGTIIAADSVQLVFGSEGGNVTGANKNYKFLIIDLT